MSAALPEGTAIVLIGHGSVTRAEDIPAFVSAIRRGRPTPQAIVDEVTHRWNAIGGSPLHDINLATAKALALRLSAPVEVAGRMWAPYAKDVVAKLASEGAKRIVSLPLAPYSAKIYNEVSREACAAAGVQCLEVSAWGTHPKLIDAFVDQLEEPIAMSDVRWHIGPDAGRLVFGEDLRVDVVGGPARGNQRVVLTAHSLPMRVVNMGDTYADEVRATADAVAAKLPLPRDCVHLAFQSQGMDGGDWLGPDLVTLFSTLAEKGTTDVIVSAIGFLADHTEVLYDLDVEAKAMAEKLGMHFYRAKSLNTHAWLVDALEDLARKAAAT